MGAIRCEFWRNPLIYLFCETNIRSLLLNLDSGNNIPFFDWNNLSNYLLYKYLEIKISNKTIYLKVTIKKLINQMVFPNQYVKIIVEDVQYKLPRQILVAESDNLQIHNNSSSVLPLPQWVPRSVYELLQRYLKTKQVKFLLNHTQNHTTIIKLLRTSDFLGLNNFHEQYITQVIIPSLNQQNCIVLLQETQKKLKNLENGAQCWFSLLNSTINYVAAHLFEIFRQDSQKLKKMNEKIMNEVFDRAIRFERKNDFQGRHILFQLIIESKNVKKVSELCKNQRQAILQKKINAKIHAKLSWKLQNVATINDKKTKNFKFLDLDWYLSAVRDPSKNTLNISLNLLSKNSTSSQEDHFTKLGIFYTKLIRTVEEKPQQSGIQINYVSFEQPKSIVFLRIDKQYQKQLGNKKLQLNIYCSLQHIYTFTLNYIIQNYQKFESSVKQFSKDETIAIICALKRMKMYSQALKVSHQLLFKGELSNQQYKQILQGYARQQLSAFEENKLKHLMKSRQLTNDCKNVQQQAIFNKTKGQSGIVTPSSHFSGRNRMSEGMSSSNTSNPYRIFSQRDSETSIHQNTTNFKFPDKFSQRFNRKSPFQTPSQPSQTQSNGLATKPSIYEFQLKNQCANLNLRNEPVNAFLISGKTQVAQYQRISYEDRSDKIVSQQGNRNSNGSFQQYSNHNKKHEQYNRGFDQKSCELKKSDSRTRPRKIFNNSPSKALFEEPVNVRAKEPTRKEQIMRVTDMRNYMINKDSSLARILAI